MPAFIVAVLVIVAFASPAHADELSLRVDFTVGEPAPKKVQRVEKAKPKPKVRHTKHTPRRKPKHPGTRVAAWKMAEPDDKFRLVCMAPVRAKGSQWINEAGALEAARKDWREEVRAEFGEKWTSIELDGIATRTCWHSGINDTGIGLYRCEIVARPCRAPAEFLNPIPAAASAD